MNKRELLSTQIVITNPFLRKQFSKLFSRSKKNAINVEDVWYIVEKLYPSFISNVKSTDLKYKVKQTYITYGYYQYTLFAEEKTGE